MTGYGGRCLCKRGQSISSTIAACRMTAVGMKRGHFSGSACSLGVFQGPWLQSYHIQSSKGRNRDHAGGSSVTCSGDVGIPFQDAVVEIRRISQGAQKVGGR